MTFFLLQNIVHISGRQVVWSYLQVEQQKREVEMVRLRTVGLGGLQSIINAFSAHEKHRFYSLKTLDEAISLVSSCDEMLS